MDQLHEDFKEAVNEIQQQMDDSPLQIKHIASLPKTTLSQKKQNPALNLNIQKNSKEMANVLTTNSPPMTPTRARGSPKFSDH